MQVENCTTTLKYIQDRFFEGVFDQKSDRQIIWIWKGRDSIGKVYLKFPHYEIKVMNDSRILFRRNLDFCDELMDSLKEVCSDFSTVSRRHICRQMQNMILDARNRASGKRTAEVLSFELRKIDGFLFKKQDHDAERMIDKLYREVDDIMNWDNCD